MRSVNRIAMTAAIALLAGAMAQAQTATGSGSYDPQIAQEAQKSLQGDKALAGVHSSVEQGIVTLSGSVDTYAEKARAEGKIRHKDHVAGVRNQIEVAGKTVPDDVLRDKIARSIRYDRIDMGQMFNNFTIGVQDGVVTIAGQVRDYPDKTSALDIVKYTPGVKDVVEKIEVLPLSMMDDRLRMAVARAVYGRLPMYAGDPQAPIRIVVENGHVSLYGVVSRNMDRQIAELQAKGVPYVFSVDDHIVVDSGSKVTKR